MAPEPSDWPWFPARDVVGPDGRISADAPVIGAVREVARTLLAPNAAISDMDGVPRRNLDALAAVGAVGPVYEPAVQRELGEIIAGACGTTWFCWTQHRQPTELISTSENEELRDRWADQLSTGHALAGVAFAHIRRSGPRTVTAHRIVGGWELSGDLDWVTSWTIADVVVIVAETDDARLVRVAVQPRRRDGLLADMPMDLAAMGGTHTCPVKLSRLQVPDTDVISVVDKAPWAERDQWGTRNAAPHIFGVTRAAISLLQDTGETRDEPEALELAQLLTDQLHEIRAGAYALIDDLEPDAAAEQRLELRAQALELAMAATSAAVTSRSGSAMRLVDPGQRYAREALFYLVQAQTSETRTASLVMQTRNRRLH
jgi:alkylation response protein AidB-like acyl-CoA dehydrogenase